MKLFKKIPADDSKSFRCGSGKLALFLMAIVPLVMIVPNVWLDISENYSAADCVRNIAIPLGLYVFLMTFRRNAIAALCLFPIMVLCAFQIVLLFLYGESIIAIDMFLNVVTTNVHEATELLRNLTPAMLAVCMLYLPPLVVSVVALKRKSKLAPRWRRAGLIGLLVSVAACALPGNDGLRRLFPANVIANIVTACQRESASAHYMDTSDAYRHRTVSTRHDSIPEVYVLVIGETSRADHWQLNGYGRGTNPRLNSREGLISYPRALSESNTTHKSVPLLMSHLDCEEFADSIYLTRSIIDAFGEAGYSTAWFSNQERNGSLIDFNGSRADRAEFLTDDRRSHHDMELCPLLASAVGSKAPKLFVVLHTYGSHFNYSERYPSEYRRFTPDKAAEASAENRSMLVNAYDNTILYTDAVLDSIMEIIESSGRQGALVYLSDHGEDIFDDSRRRFLHASPTPTAYQLHVPMLVWMSESYRKARPGIYEAAASHRTADVSSSRSAFHTLLDLAGITGPTFKAEASLVSEKYEKPERRFLNDYNEAVGFNISGMKQKDIEELKKYKISTE